VRVSRDAPVAPALGDRQVSRLEEVATSIRLAEPKRFTRLYRGRMELIDHIFVSQLLVTGTRITEVTTVTAAEGMPSIDDNPNERIGEPGSDHAAVVATFDF
jgi:hypothetical protein